MKKKGFYPKNYLRLFLLGIIAFSLVLEGVQAESGGPETKIIGKNTKDVLADPLNPEIVCQDGGIRYLDPKDGKYTFDGSEFDPISVTSNPSNIKTLKYSITKKTQNPTLIFEDFNTGMWNPQNFGLGTPNGSVISGGFVSGPEAGVRGTLRTVNHFIPTVENPIVVSATLTFFGGDEIAFIGTRSTGYKNPSFENEPSNSLYLKIRNFNDGQTNLNAGQTELNDVKLGNDFFNNPVSVVLRDNGIKMEVVLLNLVTNEKREFSGATTYSSGSNKIVFSGNNLKWDDIQISYGEPFVNQVVASGENSLDGEQLEAGEYLITWTAIDEDGNETSCNTIVSILEPNQLFVTANEGQSKVYGDSDPILTYTVIGFKDGDGEELKSGKLEREAGEVVGSYLIGLGSLRYGDKYTIQFTSANFLIKKKNVTISAENKSKEYGAPNPPLTFTYSGLVNGDTKISVEPEISTTATTTSGLGNYPINLTGGSDPNYEIVLTPGTLTIGKKKLTITADDKSKMYGDPNPVLTFTYSGLVNGDTKISVEPSISTTAIQSSPVGTYPITLTGGSDDNYEITLKAGTLTVGKKALTITAENKTKVYGDANPTLTFSYSGLVNGDTKVSVEPTISTTAVTSSPVGDYPITLTGGSDANYDIKLVDGVLKITKALLTIKANPQSKIFGTVDPVLTFTATGFKNNDTVSSLTGQLSRDPGEAVGIYQIKQGTLTSANYELVFISDKFEILPAVIISVTNPDLITTPWSVVPTLPTQLSVVTADGQVITINVTWDLSTLNVFKRGRYFVTGTLILPAGVQNPQGYQATLEIVVLPKPAPLDITLSNNVFIPDPKNYFQVIGTFTVIDPIDNIHIISLVSGAVDNQYFEIKEGILFWSSADKVAGRTTFTILVRVVDRDGNQIEKSFQILRERVDINGLEVYNTFTPNGDGINDTWGVPDLRYYTGVRVQVFDRGGERVFYTEDADKRWDGTYKGKEMPVGSYYWNLQVIETGDIRRRGILNLLKQ